MIILGNISVSQVLLNCSHLLFPDLKNLHFKMTDSQWKNGMFDCFNNVGNCKLKWFHIVWKLLKMSHLNFWILSFSTNFCPIKVDLSGNTVWPQASGFQKLAKMDYFGYFWWTFVHSKCKRNVKWDFFCNFQTLWVS